jgi:hypothetical protein
LLAQTGVVGTAIFFLPILLFPSLRKRLTLLRRPIFGNTIVPVVVVIMIRLMVDVELADVGTLIGLIAAMSSRPVNIQ